MPTINPKWRTETVAALCRRMLDLRDFAALPILADALQEAGCTDVGLLTNCQYPNLARVDAERITNLLFSTETAVSVTWLDDFGGYLEFDYRYDKENPREDYTRAIQIGHDALTSGSMNYSMNGSNTFGSNRDKIREYFVPWSRVTGVAVLSEVRETVRVCCSC